MSAQLVELNAALPSIIISAHFDVVVKNIDTKKCEWGVFYQGVSAAKFFAMSDALENSFKLVDGLRTLEEFSKRANF